MAVYFSLFQLNSSFPSLSMFGLLRSDKILPASKLSIWGHYIVFKMKGLRFLLSRTINSTAISSIGNIFLLSAP